MTWSCLYSLWPASPTRQTMVSGERPKALRRGEKTSNTSLQMRFRACDRSSTRCRAGVCGTASVYGSALLSKHTTASGITVTWRATLSTRGKKASSPSSSLKQENTPPTLPNHFPCSTCKQPIQPGPETDKATALGAPRGRGTPQLSQAAGLVHPHVPLQGLGSVCTVSCTLLYSPPSV